MILSQKSKVVITDYGFPTIATGRWIIEGAARTLDTFQCKTAEDVIASVQDVEALFVQWAPVTRAVIEALPKLKAIVRYGIGLDNVDLDAAREREERS